MCGKALAEFVPRAWPVVEPGKHYRSNLASDAIVEHLQAVADGQLRRLLVTVPPGLAKSTLCAVVFPAWMLARDATWRVIAASYAQSLAVRDSLRTRRLVESGSVRSSV